MGYGRQQEMEWAAAFHAEHARFGLPASLLGQRIKSQWGNTGRLVGIGRLVGPAAYLVVETYTTHPTDGYPVRGVQHWDLEGPHATRWEVA